MRDVSNRLREQKGVPTYADVLRLLDLTPKQMYGLQSSLYAGGEHPHPTTFVKEIWAAHDLLELLQDRASPLGNGAHVPTWEEIVKHRADDRLDQVILTGDGLTTRQLSLLPAYLQAQPHQLSPEQSADFFAVIYRPSESAEVGVHPNHRTIGQSEVSCW
jgi:hypothetical protein